MTENYKLDERILKSIIKNKIKCASIVENFKLNIYQENLKTNNLVMNNNMRELKS